jgi:hypothetical protein
MGFGIRGNTLSDSIGQLRTFKWKSGSFLRFLGDVRRAFVRRMRQAKMTGLDFLY